MLQHFGEWRNYRQAIKKHLKTLLRRKPYRINADRTACAKLPTFIIIQSERDDGTLYSVQIWEDVQDDSTQKTSDTK